MMTSPAVIAQITRRCHLRDRGVGQTPGIFRVLLGTNCRLPVTENYIHDVRRHMQQGCCIHEMEELLYLQPLPQKRTSADMKISAPPIVK